jgi:hypothetical protein
MAKENPNLEPAGVQLKAEGKEAFDRAIKQVNDRFDSMMKKQKELAKEAQKTNAALKKIVPDGEIDKSLEKTNQRMARLMGRMRDMQAEIRKTKKDLGGLTSTTAEAPAKAQRGSEISSLLAKLPGGDRLSQMFEQIPGVDKLVRQIPGLSKLSPMLSQITAAFGNASAGSLKMAAAVGIAAVAVGVLVKGFMALGKRGAAMEGVIRSFSMITQMAGIDGYDMLSRLQTAAAGTITRLEGMRLTNLALAGASKTLGQELGNKLPQLMAVARAQSRATGQDVNYLFESLITGIKRSSPLLIDNTGLVLRVSEAKAAYAKQIGKSAEALTEEEEKIAILNATLAAGQTAVDTYGKGALTAAERMQKMRATITDTLDRASVAVQPLFKTLLEIGQAILDVIVWPFNNIIIPLFYEFSKVLSESVMAQLREVAKFLKTAFGPAIQNLREWIAYGIIAIRAFGKTAAWIREQLHSLLGPAFDWVARQIGNFFRLFSPRRFAEGATNTFGAYAGGILWAANTLVAPAVVALATMVADFLCGFSPPPKGPLSKIDEGGANVIDAWLEGMGMASMKPVSDVAAAVDAELGSVGQMGFSQVETRLKTLDLALRPYQEALDIAKAKMAALVDPLNKVKDIIQKKLDLQLKTFLAGGATADSVRAIDRQAEAVATYTSSLEDATTEQEYQLVLAQARQAQERALLNIQKNRLGEQAKADTTTDKSAVDSTAGGGGSGSELPDLAAAATPLLGGVGDPLAAFTGVDEDQVNAQMAGLATAFTQGFAATGGPEALAGLRRQGDELNKQVGRMKSSTPFQAVTKSWDLLFGEGPTSLQGKFATFSASFQTAWDVFWGDDGNVAATMASFVGTLSSEWGIGGTVGLLFDTFSLVGIEQTFRTTFGIDNVGIRAILNGFRTKAHINFDPGGLFESIFGGFSLSTIITTFGNAFGEDGSIRGYFTTFLEFVTGVFSLGGSLSAAFGHVEIMLQYAMVRPLVRGINRFIDVICDGINKSLSAINFVGGGLGAILNTAGIENDFDGLRLDSGNYHISVPGAKIGGVFGPGLLKTHKDEVIASGASKLTVFPVRWVQAMERLASGVSTAPRYAPAYGGAGSSQTISNSNSLTVNFNARENRQNYRMKLSEARAFGWPH